MIIHDKEYRERQSENIDAVPAIQFDEDMEVKMLPPFWWALVRLEVNWYSIYFDADETLGLYGWKPYREIYDPDSGCSRFVAEDTEWLLDRIRELS